MHTPTLAAGIISACLWGYVPSLASAGSDASQTAAPTPALQPGTPMIARRWTHDPQKFSFAILGDKTGGFDVNWPIFDRAIEEVNRLDPDFVIMVGDLIQGYTEDTMQVMAQWEEFHRHADRIEVPFLMLPGNHDVEHPLGLDWWKRHVGRTYYDLTYNGCHLLVLNTDEVPDERDVSLGEEQVRFAVEALSRHRDARHTFVFMHKPAWVQENDEWACIEAALGDRPFTVFAGHWHNLVYERRNGRVYIVHGPTGADASVNPVREMGEFHHYTLVTVDGDSVHVSIEEPGHAWPVDIATAEFSEKVNAAVQGRPRPPSLADLGAGRMSVEYPYDLANDLQDTLTAVFRQVVEEGTSWTMQADSLVFKVAPGERDSLTLRFVGRSDRRVPVPTYEIIRRYGGQELARHGPLTIHPFQQGSWLFIPDWMVMGPFDVGPVDPKLLPDSPREAVPGMFQPRPPDGGWRAGATYDERGRTFRWNRASLDTMNRLDANRAFGARDHLLGYAASAVYSPEDQRVAAWMRADNYMQVFVNGALVGELFASPYDAKYVTFDVKAGWNPILVKLVNNRGDWYFLFNLFDTKGNLRTAAQPE